MNEPRRPGRPRKPKPEGRKRAISPFLLTPKKLTALPAGDQRAQADRELAEAARAADDSTGLLALSDLSTDISAARFDLTPKQISHASEILERLQEAQVEPYAPNSRKSMRADWRHWIAFCVQRNRVALPIAFSDIVEFLDALIDANYRRATLEHLTFTLGVASRLWSCPPVFETFEFKAYWRDRCRKYLSKSQQQAKPLNIGLVDQLGDMADSPRAIRDAAFVSVAYDMVLRASEIVALKWADLEFHPQDQGGGATCLIARSKTDQHGEGKVLFLSPQTVVLLRAWGEYRNSENPYIFHALPRFKGQKIDTTRPFAVREVSRIFARAGVKAGADGRLSGHSARVGAAQDMVSSGMDLAAVMQQGRWKSAQMVSKYAENILATRAGRDRHAKLKNMPGRQSKEPAQEE